MSSTTPSRRLSRAKRKEKLKQLDRLFDSDSSQDKAEQMDNPPSFQKLSGDDEGAEPSMVDRKVQNVKEKERCPYCRVEVVRSSATRQTSEIGNIDEGDDTADANEDNDQEDAFPPNDDRPNSALPTALAILLDIWTIYRAVATVFLTFGLVANIGNVVSYDPFALAFAGSLFFAFAAALHIIFSGRDRENKTVEQLGRRFVVAWVLLTVAFAGANWVVRCVQLG